MSRLPHVVLNGYSLFPSDIRENEVIFIETLSAKSF